ncbi:NAD(P)-dependent oxidoreductase [Nesterenkonia ebinurensis]|uniref:NAD(P)-dependent oxidoreductase n=1 Tax=Nesterenkonia ebinurensis TaxID=2608252 RepID=UPI00123DA085|nr:NAD(P)-binding domain-containing protein [Nesterenkonia ebinurensis]
MDLSLEGSVAVLGTGAMGSAIAKAVLAAGRPTTVWNRTSGRAQALGAHGAIIADSPSQAVKSADVVVVCVLDHTAVMEVLSSLGSAINGRQLVNFTSSNPAQAREAARWAEAQHAQYLDASIMAGPENIGSEEAMLFYSGSETTYQEHKRLLQSLGGVSKFYGPDPGSAAAYFTALVTLGYETWDSYLRNLAYVEAEGGDLSDFSPLAVDSVVSSGPLLKAMVQAAQTGVHPLEMGPLRTHAALMGDVIDSREQAGVGAAPLRQLKAWIDQSVHKGHVNDGFSRLIDEIRLTRH